MNEKLTPQRQPAIRWLLFLFFLQLLALSASAQVNQLTGRVVDKTGAGLPGATVVVKGTTNGTTTDERGDFTLKNVPAGRTTLLVSFVGYANRELAVPANQEGKRLLVNLDSDSKQIDEVVVTGVFDKRQRMDASIAISTISAAQIELQVPNSSADLLRNVPGVYVNSSLGEVNNTVYARGVTAPGSSSYYYVSMQEDGLPITNVNFASYGPDFFLRADATTGRLEAVRGGAAAITGPNTPGGIFNYVSKTGGQTFGGEVRAKFGLEGNAQPFYRTDVSLGGKLNEKGDLTFNVGGFYRYANGARYAGYAMNRGGQGKLNIVKTYGRGSLRLYGKYLDDRNSYTEAMPAVGFDHPELAPGVRLTDTYVPNSSLAFNYPYNSAGDVRNFDIRNLIHNQDRAIGLDWQHDLGGGWSFQNNVKYTNKSRDWQNGILLGPVALNSVYTYVLPGALGTFGNYSFTDATNGQVLATYTQSPRIVGGQFAGFNFTKTSTADLPGTAVQPNSLLLQALSVNTIKVQEVIDQANVTKKVSESLSVTVGGYMGVSHVTYDNGIAGLAFSTIENQPHPVQISGVGSDGRTRQYTNPQGVAALGLGSFTGADYRQTQLAGFASATWKITPELTFDGGVRYDNMHIAGTNLLGMANPANVAGYGGLDGNPLTVYDNLFTVRDPNSISLDKTFNTFAFSGALNYRFAPGLALYGRYSDGKKAPDLSPFVNLGSASEAALFTPQVQQVRQVEAGFKMERDRLSLFVTPFYSLLSGIPVSAFATDANNVPYFTPTIYNSIETYGLELEGNYSITTHLSTRASATLQHATAKDWGVWITGNPGPQDDVVQDFSGNRAENVPKVMLTLAPTYTTDHFAVFANFRYLSDRAANVPNAFYLPGFGQLDLGASYNFTKTFGLQLNVNNVTNALGMMSFTRPGGFPVSSDRQGFTAVQRDANPNAAYAASFVQPRSYYLQAVYKF